MNLLSALRKNSRVQVNIHYARTHLSRVLRVVAAGAEVTIARAGVPVARFVAIEAKKEIPKLEKTPRKRR